METNKVFRIKQLVTEISKANKAYYGDDDPIMTDKEFDDLFDELKKLEEETGIVFADSPTKGVGGFNKGSFKKVEHSKPMLSAKKTKSVKEFTDFIMGRDMLLSWKMDGLTIVLRYENGRFKQAVTRGENGLIGEDITHTVRYMRSVPHKVKETESFEVRGEGVISWSDYGLVNRNNEQGHPRNTAAGLVRSMTPDKGNLAHMDFYAFELIYPGDLSTKKHEQLEFLSINGFRTVEYKCIPRHAQEKDIIEYIESFVPEKYEYPVDGLIAEFDDIALGQSLGATAHHENRMLALKWEDTEFETVFRGVELGTTKSGMITLTAKFDPVTIDGARIDRADLHSVTNFEKFRFGIGDTITVYRANMIIPQIGENKTQSGTYKLPELCPCCGSRLETKMSSGGKKNIFCPNDDCIAKNAQKIARFCDKNAMNISGFSAGNLEKLMAFGIIKNYSDLYSLEKKKEKILTTPGFGYESYSRMVLEVENSRRCHLFQFLMAVGIPLMNYKAARALDEFYYGSWDNFENAIKEGFVFSHIADVSPSLSRNIYRWYEDKKEERLWRPVLKEISFVRDSANFGKKGNPFYNAQVVITGIVNGMNSKDIAELLKLLGANVCDSVTKSINYLIVGEQPETDKLSKALADGVTIITEGHFSRMLSESEAANEDE